jgi:hypothetical protein
MQPTSGDVEPDIYAAGEADSATRRAINVDAHAEPLATQLVTGDGNIHYAPTFHTGHEWLRSDEITNNQVATAQRAFVTPPRYDRAWDKLTSKNVLVISAALGTGKKTAALNLLAELRHPRPEHQHAAHTRPDLGLRELDGDWEKPRVSKLPLFPQQGLLLDMSDSLDQTPDEEFGTNIVDYAAKLATIQSYLIILATPEVWKACAGPASDLTEDDLGYPLARDIIEARLRQPSSQYLERVQWLDDDEFREVLRHDLRPGDADGLYEAIVVAENSPAGRANAIDQFHGWRNYLTGWWQEESSDRGPYERAMQIVMATIGRAPAGDVLTLTDDFLKTAGHAANVHLPLSGPDLSERLRRAGAVPDKEGFVDLEPHRPRFHGAILDHVWRERIQIQGHYKQWIVQVTQRGHVGKNYVEQIAASVTGMGIRQNSVEFLELIETWVKNQADQDTLAVRMLEDTCLDPVVGAKVRKQMRTWAEQKTTPDRLVNIIITVCQGELARQRTVVALTRLKKILLRSNARVFTSAVSAAIAAIARYPDRLHKVLAEVVEWMKDAHAAPGRIGFLALMTSDVDMTPDSDSPVVQLLNECRRNNKMREELADAWHAVIYANPGDEQVVVSIRNLLAFANKNRTFVDIAVGILGPAMQGELKKTIAGRVLLNAAIDDVEDDDTAHAKLLGVLFDEPPRTASTAPMPADFDDENAPVPVDPVDHVATSETTNADDDTSNGPPENEPSEVANSLSAPAQPEGVVEAPTDGSAWNDQRDATLDYGQPGPPSPNAPPYLGATAAPPPDDDRGERRGWFRR